MKKIILTSALLAIFSTSSIYSNTLSNVSMDNMYVKVAAFAGIGAKVKPSETKYGETTFNGSIGVGFNAMEQVRAELLVSYLNGPEYDSSPKMTSEGWVGFVNGYVEAVDLGSAKLAVGGGLGVSMLQSSLGDDKYADDFAFSWNVGGNFSFEATPEAAIELGYTYANYGKPGSHNDGAWDKDARASHNVSLGLRFNM